MSEQLKIIGLCVNALSFEESLDRVMQLGRSHIPSWVGFVNVHMTIEAYKDPIFRNQLDYATLLLPDGRPIAAACRWLYGKRQERIAGMDFLPRILQRANQAPAPVFLYGATPELLKKLSKKIQEDYPGVQLAGTIAPPFGPIPETALQQHIQQINDSGAAIVMVALGCPKQEKWMAANYQKINAVLLGLGGAFAVAAGLQKRSPRWMQAAGLEWLYRLIQEPRRLFKRYFLTNSLFIWLMAREIVKSKSRSPHANTNNL